MGPENWAPADLDPIALRLAQEAHKDVGEMEDLDAHGHGTNRGRFPDLCNHTTGAPLGSPWCAGATSLWADRAGVHRPRQYAGSCDEWVRDAKAHGTWKTGSPQVGDFVVYTNGRKLTSGRYAGQLDAYHIGVVTRTSPVLKSVEGNTTSTAFSRDGTGVAHKDVDSRRVYGYIRPTPAGG